MADKGSSPEEIIASLEAENALLHKKTVALDRLASVGMLTAGIAHEIKNPISLIKNFAEAGDGLVDELKEALSEKQISDSEIDELLSDLQENSRCVVTHATRAQGIVTHMLTHARGEDSGFSSIDISELIHQYVALSYHGMRAQYPQYNVKIEKDIPSELPVVMGNQEALGRVLLNLCNNAIYAANTADTQAPQLHISAKQVNDYLEIAVRDNGPGIAPEHQAKLFEPLFTTKPEADGTGLGLSLVKEIIESDHHGQLLVTNESPSGACFTVRLPIESNTGEK